MVFILLSGVVLFMVSIFLFFKYEDLLRKLFFSLWRNDIWIMFKIYSVEDKICFVCYKNIYFGIFGKCILYNINLIIY